MIEERAHRIREDVIMTLPNLTGGKISRKKDNHELERLFEESINIQNPRELLGSWYVFMLTGILPSFRRWKHHKVFHLPSKQVNGYNAFILPITGKFEWGRNRITTPPNYILINYDIDENSPLFRPIRDQIKFVPELGIFIGRFCYKYDGDSEEHPTFIGYFILAPTFIFKYGSMLAKLCGQYTEGRFVTLCSIG